MLFCGIWYRNSWEQFYTEKDTHTTKIYQKKIQSANRVRNTVTTNASNSWYMRVRQHISEHGLSERDKHFVSKDS